MGKYIVRLAMAFGAVLLLLLILCGCQASLRCTDPIGCITLNPNQPLTIGIEKATTGDESAVSQLMMDAIKLASSQQPLIYHHPIQFYTQDTPCTLHENIFTTGLMVSQPDLVAVIGPACPEGDVAYAKILSDAGIPLFSAAREIDTSNLPGVFNLFPSSQDLADGLDLLLSKSSGFKNFDLVVWNGTLEDHFSSDFCALWQKRGYQCSHILSLQPDNLAASDIASQINNTPEASLLIVLPFTSLDQIPDLRDIVGQRKIVLFDPELNPWDKNLDPYWEDVSVVTYHWQLDNNSARLFRSTGPPEIHSLLAYDAYQMLLKSITGIVKFMPDGKIVIHKQALRQSFAKIGDYSGLAGNYSFTDRNSGLKIEDFLGFSNQ